MTSNIIDIILTFCSPWDSLCTTDLKKFCHFQEDIQNQKRIEGTLVCFCLLAIEQVTYLAEKFERNKRDTRKFGDKMEHVNTHRHASERAAISCLTLIPLPLSLDVPQCLSSLFISLDTPNAGWRMKHSPIERARG